MENSSNDPNKYNLTSCALEEKQEEKEYTSFEKIIQLNKLGALFLSSDKFEKALSILKKTLDFYIDKKVKKEIPNLFYSNLYCNLGKTYSCLKDFKNAEEIYKECILNNTLHKILLTEKEYIKENFLIDLDKLLEIENLNSEHKEELEKKLEILMNFFNSGYDCNESLGKHKNNFLREEFQKKILKRFKPNNLNSLSSFTDSLVNLAVIFQYFYKESITSFNMYYLAILLEPDNMVANVDFNNFLRENNLKEKSDEYISRRVIYDYLYDNSFDNLDKENSGTVSKSNSEIKIQQIAANESRTNINDNISSNSKEKKLSFASMKWGTKYNAEYVNKLYRGLKRRTSSEFSFYCITDDSTGFDEGIIYIELKSDFKGWMRKCSLFSEYYINKLTSNGEDYVCFIDLDMIVYSSIDFLWNYNGDFCVMKTDDIQCENSVNGYNSSIIIWRKDFGKEIYENMYRYSKYFTCQVVRFDHYLEFVVKNSDFIQDIFPEKVLDYNTYCKGKEILSSNGAIIAFPRYPKPHECKEEWVNEHWK